MTEVLGPQTAAADRLHGLKYRQRNEDFREAMNRVAFGLKDDDRHYHQLREILLPQRFLPGGRVQGAIGAMRQTTAFNCLSGDTEVLTGDGYARLSDMVGRTIDVLSPISGAFERAEVKAFGEQDLYDITISNSAFGQTRSGSFVVRATKNHRWILQDGKITESLQEGDVLKAGAACLEEDNDGWVHGFIYGDGYKVRDEVPGSPRSNPLYADEYPFKKFNVRLCGKKTRHINKFLGSSLKTRITYPPSNDYEPLVMCLSKRDLKLLPADTETPEYIGSFVKGLLDADGCFSVRDDDSFSFHGIEETVVWVRDRLIYADYAPSGRSHECTNEPTNYGERTEPMWMQRFRPCSEHRGFRVVKVHLSSHEKVYCVVEKKHRQIILRNGLRTGNCYVSGSIADSYTDGPGSIMTRAHEAAATMRMGGGIGYDFSTLRPRGSLIRKLQSQSTGPINFMGIFNEICLCTSSSGHRRGAQMGVLRVDHPDIEEFILAKQNAHALLGFNVSVAVTDEFMEAALNNKSFDLKFNGEVHRTVDAAELWERIMRSTWDFAEPGVLFLDRVNEMNNLYYCETISATNPCGEQPLPPFGACLLGSFNLTKYLTHRSLKIVDEDSGLSAKYDFDFDQLAEDIPAIVRAMDNVTDRTRYPLAEQRAEAISKRRMGLGVTGLANAAEACGYAYGSSPFLVFEARVLETIRDRTYLASTDLAREKGPFPLFDAPRFLAGKFAKTLTEPVRELIERHGMRNSHLTSIAPTGTISMCADNVSSSIEPVFAYSTSRPVNTPTGPVTEVLEDYGASVLNTRGKLAADVTAEEHVDVLITAQKYVDSAVSKTVNMDGRTMPWADFKDIYKRAFEGGAKGCTTFNASGLRGALLSSADKNEASACVIDETGRRECA